MRRRRRRGAARVRFGRPPAARADFVAPAARDNHARAGAGAGDGAEAIFIGAAAGGAVCVREPTFTKMGIGAPPRRFGCTGAAVIFRARTLGLLSKSANEPEHDQRQPHPPAELDDEGLPQAATHPPQPLLEELDDGHPPPQPPHPDDELELGQPELELELDEHVGPQLGWQQPPRPPLRLRENCRHTITRTAISNAPIIAMSHILPPEPNMLARRSLSDLLIVGRRPSRPQTRNGRGLHHASRARPKRVG